MSIVRVVGGSGVVDAAGPPTEARCLADLRQATHRPPPRTARSPKSGGREEWIARTVFCPTVTARMLGRTGGLTSCANRSYFPSYGLFGSTGGGPLRRRSSILVSVTVVGWLTGAAHAQSIPDGTLV